MTLYRATVHVTVRDEDAEMLHALHGHRATDQPLRRTDP